MFLEYTLRRWPVGRRITVMFALLLLPVLGLSLASLMVVNEQEATFRDSVEESIHTLMPLTTLEHYLQQAMVDELLAQSHESVPDFSTLTDNVDNSFASIEANGHSADVQESLVVAAQQSWQDARPSVRELIAQVRTLRQEDDPASQARARADLQAAIHDISTARQQLSRVVEARYARAIAHRQAQLTWLVGCWFVTLAASGLLVATLLYSLLRPIRTLGRATADMGRGEIGIRVPIIGNDELAVLAKRFNEMAARWETSRQALVRDATVDPLTGVLNRRGILAALESAIATCAAMEGPLSVFMLDLNDFKAINDQFGHAVGDRALGWVTTQVRRMLRAGDLVGRYGGDEFIVVLPDMDRDHAAQIAQRMARAVGEAAAAEATLPSISIGMACMPDDGSSAEALIQVADGALYAAKRARAVT